MTAWTNPRYDGAGTWQHTPRHRSAFPDLLTAFLACLIFCALLAGLYVVGKSWRCHAYDNALQGCPGYVEQHPVSERER